MQIFVSKMSRLAKTGLVTEIANVACEALTAGGG
jgi:hypothetical protein